MSKTVKILIIVVAAVLLLTSGVVAFFVISSTGEAKDEPRFVFDPGDSFVTNVSDDKALVKSTIVIQVIGEDVLKELESNSMRVRDDIISVLRGKTKEEMLSADIQEQLKTEICGRIASDLGIEGVETVYFREFVIQQ